MIVEHTYYYSRSANGDGFSSNDPNLLETTSYSTGISKNNVKGYWRFEGNAMDASSNNGTGTFYGNATATKRGYIGSGLTLDGSGDYVGVPYSSALNISGSSITISAWVKFNATTGYHFVLEKGANIGKHYYMWWHNTLGLIVGYYDGSAYRDYIYNWTPTLGTWYHLAWTSNGSTVYIYINGTSVASFGQIGSLQNASTGGLDIGRQWNSGFYFNGIIDDVRINDRTLSSQEIRSVYMANVTTTYADGLGRDVQKQTRLGNDDIITPTTYDPVSRLQKAFKPYLQVANGHKYDGNYVANSNTYYPGDATYTYGEMQYLNDPLERPQKQGGPGAPFRIGASPEKVAKQEYWSNAAGETGYSANTLTKVRSIDEDGKIIDTFADKFGNTVASTVDAAGLNLKTTFEYDVMGKMTKSIPPTGTTHQTTYAYTTLQQLRQKTSPDAETWTYTYDLNGNLRFTIDGSSQNLYQKYDGHNRVIEVGRYTGPGGDFNQTNANISSFPSTSKLREKTFDYDFPSSDALAAGQRNLTGRVAAAHSYNADSYVWSTFYSYDELGRIEWIVQKNTWGKAWKITYTYDLQGRVTKKAFADSYNGYNLYTYNEYDQIGRLTKVSTNGGMFQS